jgi:hypothetical protein
MKFLPKTTGRTPTQEFSGIQKVEKYIELTKNNINNHLPLVTMRFSSNVTENEKAAIKNFKQKIGEITIKPADKNLGLVLLNTDDYLSQCVNLLSDSNTYRPASSYPKNEIKRLISNTFISFKPQLSQFSKRLYQFLLSEPDHCRIPQFYGIPKIHKEFTNIPPVRPIISQCSSLLNPTARFIDHVLQPLAQSYPDYLHNSTSLSLILQNLTVPDNAILVTLDVSNLYPSIPQSDMLQVIYNEMFGHRHLLLFDPNLIIQLLYTGINFNYFEFASVIFQQIKGTAMGAAFSPTVANIYMSVTIRRFLRTQTKQPLLLSRYIDDIFLVWTDTKEDLEQFLADLNNFNRAIHYTNSQSCSSVDFLDLTIYKGHLFPFTNILDTKTYQKPQNLYQYLHYSSCHQPAVYKSIISGELVRYARTNTCEASYEVMKTQFKHRLLARGYPKKLIEKLSATVLYKNRPQFLKKSQLPPPRFYPPLFKCPPPPQFKLLKRIVLENYHELQNLLPAPRFIPMKHPTLQNELVRTKVTPTDEQLIDIHTIFMSYATSEHTTAGKLPQLNPHNTRTKRCNHPRCVTCLHLNCSKYFTSTRSRITYTIRHNFSCTSNNLIYLITCKKCRKQYVGLTTKQLNVRVNHHRTNIMNHKSIYLSTHFNFADHSITDLSIQAIDTVTSDCPNMLQELQKLEKYWIQKLKTVQPLGLNVSTGTTTTKY